MTEFIIEREHADNPEMNSSVTRSLDYFKKEFPVYVTFLQFPDFEKMTVLCGTQLLTIRRKD